MTDDQPAPPESFPQFPAGLNVAHPKQAAPLQKLIGKMFRPKLRSPARGRGIQSRSTVKFGHKKVKFY